MCDHRLMPQTSILPEHPPMTGLSIVIKSWPHTALPDQVDVVVSIRNGDYAYNTCWVGALTHNERDYLNTLVEEVTMSYMYGEDRRDVQKACASVKKLARAHERQTSP